MTDTWQRGEKTCWHVKDELSPCCDAPIGTNGTDLWCCACRRPLVRKVPCDVYSRVVGYIRPVGWWNEGKRQEFEERQTYVIRGVQ